MKTYINYGVSYKDAPIQRKIDWNGINDYIEKNIRHITRKHKRQQSVTDVQKGDIVTLNLESHHSQFNRSALKLAVGSGMFDKELESALIGLHVGEDKDIVVYSEKVKVQIIESIRILFPSATDEMIQEFTKNDQELQNIHTVNEYKDYLTKKYKKEFYDKIVEENMSSIIDYVITHTDWEFDEEEIQYVYDLYLQELKKELNDSQKTLETLSKDELKLEFGVDSLDGLYTYIRNTAEYSIACAIFQVMINNKDPKDYTFEQALELEWDVLEKYVKSQMKD